MSKAIEGSDVKIVANEKYGRADTSVTGQVLNQDDGCGDFLRIAGKSAENVILPIGPVLVPSQLADNHPSKKVITEFVKAFTTKFGTPSFARP